MLDYTYDMKPGIKRRIRYLRNRHPENWNESLDYVHTRLQGLTAPKKQKWKSVGKAQKSSNPPTDSQACHFQGKHFRNSAFSNLATQVREGMKFKSLVLPSPAASELSENFRAQFRFMPPVYSAPWPEAVSTYSGWCYRLQPPCCFPCLTSKKPWLGIRKKGGQACGGPGEGWKTRQSVL